MTPTLYSFRRCPYAIRARLALASSGRKVELREVVLRDKPRAFLEVSPSATVPCLKTNQCIIDESLDVMKWALEQHDPEGWLSMPQDGWGLISRNDGPFKDALDRTKYHTRYPDSDMTKQRDIAAAFLEELNDHIDIWLFEQPTIADFAILPFVRQFAFIDKDWFDEQPWQRLQLWLDRFLMSERFHSVMLKYPKWHEGDAPSYFPES